METQLKSKSRLSVGVRELHNRTSELVKQVAAGGELEITLHGKPVARLVPVNEDDPIDRLRRRGMIREATNTGFVPNPIKLKSGATVSEIISEQRG